MLKGTKKNITEIEYHELDNAIVEFLQKKGIPLPLNYYKKPEYCVVAQEEWSNDSDHLFLVEPEQPEDYDLESLKEGELGFMTNTILNWMCAEGEIEAGEWNVSVCW